MGLKLKFLNNTIYSGVWRSACGFLYILGELAYLRVLKYFYGIGNAIFSWPRWRRARVT